MNHSQTGSAVSGCTGWRYFAASHTPQPPLHFRRGHFLYGKWKERQCKERKTAVKHCNSTVEVGGLFVRRFPDTGRSPFCYLYLFTVYNVVFESCNKHHETPSNSSAFSATIRGHKRITAKQFVDTSESLPNNSWTQANHCQITLQFVDTSESLPNNVTIRGHKRITAKYTQWLLERSSTALKAEKETGNKWLSNNELHTSVIILHSTWTVTCIHTLWRRQQQQHWHQRRVCVCVCVCVCVNRSRKWRFAKCEF
jgi:hypothetical protein